MSSQHIPKRIDLFLRRLKKPTCIWYSARIRIAPSKNFVGHGSVAAKVLDTFNHKPRLSDANPPSSATKAPEGFAVTMPHLRKNANSSSPCIFISLKF